MKIVAIITAILGAFASAPADLGPLWIKPSLPDIGICGIRETQDQKFVWVMDEGGLKQFDLANGTCLRVGPRLPELSYGDPVNVGGTVVAWDRQSFKWIDGATGAVTKQVATNTYFYNVVAGGAARVAALYTGNVYKVVDLDSGQLLYTLGVQPSFSPDGHYMVKRSGGVTQLANPRTGLVFGQIPMVGGVLGWGTRPTGEQLAYTGVQIWELSPGNNHLLKSFTDSAWQTISQDGSRYVRCDLEGNVSVFDTVSWKVVASYPIPGYSVFPWQLYRIHLVDQGQTLLVFDTDGGIALDAISGDYKYELYESSGAPNFASNSTIGEVLVVGNTPYQRESSLVLRNRLTGQLIRKLPWESDLYKFTVNADGSRIAQIEWEPKRISVYQTDDGSELSSLVTENVIAISPNTLEFISSEYQVANTLDFRDIVTGGVLRSVSFPHIVSTVALWSQDGKKLAVRSSGGYVYLVDCENLMVVGQVLIPGFWDSAIQGMSSDGNRVLARGNDTLNLVDFLSASCTPLESFDYSNAAAIAPDGLSYVVSDPEGIRFSLIGKPTFKKYAFPSEHTGQLRYSTDGKLVYYAASNGAVACFRNPIPMVVGRG